MEIAERIGLQSNTKTRLPYFSLFRIALPALALITALLLHTLVPNVQPVLSTRGFTIVLSVILLLFLTWFVASLFRPGVFKSLHYFSNITTFIIALIVVWELLTLKSATLPLPYFPSPVKILDALINDRHKLLICVLYSLRLLVIGYLIGAVFGLATGILMGWYKHFQYWVNPFLRFIGPIPATAWIPVVLIIFPSSFTASIFLIALGTWFPVTVMTWSGIAGVNKSFFEVARTLGAKERYLILRVAVPAAFPLIFIGLFMGLGTSFVTLIVAEMLGVKAGLGFYITWAQGWAEYYKVYAALFIMAVLFSTIITVLFKIRDRILIWQKGLIKW
ncbi:ABC transporter permease [Cohnella abietis]|uniref:ABC transporter permease n=1 Tax=Cohnella abietis TaxID=2507935 RepID=A0A3T1D0N8_9BACL|nr:ABC transporter permease subunit [Cohnella abietis]BBI31628.1 ABC transporter permease [Cohnella abietis]